MENAGIEVWQFHWGLFLILNGVYTLLYFEITFQVFVANPNKPKPILDILLRNQDKLVDFLSKFHNDRSDDEQFNDEKAYLIKLIKETGMLHYNEL